MLIGLLRRAVPALLLLGLARLGVQAQTGVPVRVRGLVLAAEDHRPIPGAGVFVAKTGTGTAADVLGSFQLTIQRSDTLMVRAVGFRTRRFTLKPNAPAEIAIEVLLEVD